jgi:hypothetical protein
VHLTYEFSNAGSLSFLDFLSADKRATMAYHVSATELPHSEHSHSEIVNERVLGNGTRERTLRRRFGVLFKVQVAGSLGRFSFLQVQRERSRAPAGVTLFAAAYLHRAQRPRSDPLSVTPSLRNLHS